MESSILTIVWRYLQHLSSIIIEKSIFFLKNAIIIKDKTAK